MDDTTYQQLADATLQQLEAALEPAFSAGALEELELSGSVLTIATPDGRSFIVSKHLPSQQIWLASPRLGGLHFIRSNDGWALPDGRLLGPTLAGDLAQSGVEVTL
jgi:iron donor protein CyaY